jgi:hypothetical protein
MLATLGGDGAGWGGGIPGGRFGRPGHFTKRALGHDQVLARTRFASADARLLAAKSIRETQVPWTRLAGPRRPLPGPAKITDIPVRAAHGGARPTRMTAIGGDMLPGTRMRPRALESTLEH